MKILFIILLIAVCAPAWAAAQGPQYDPVVSKDGINGKWVLNPRRSSQEHFSHTPPGNIYLTIKHEPPAISFSTSSDDSLSDVMPFVTSTIYTDGRSFDIFPDMLKRGFSGKVDLSGSKLVIEIYNKSKVLCDQTIYEIIDRDSRLRHSWRMIDSMGRNFDGFAIYDRVKAGN